MAQIEQSDKGGKKKKGAQKKMSIHVDFTPMVDMNMLLITFFMLCTTMIKSQTLQIILPSNDKNIKDEQKNQAKADEAVTLILDTEYDQATKQPKHDENGNTIHNIYFYEGMAMIPQQGGDTIHAKVKLEQFLGNQNGSRQGIRKILYERNKTTMDKYDELKKDFKEKKITKEQFEEMAKKNATDTLVKHPVVIIKPGPNTTYEGLISAIDELQLNQIKKYSIQMPDHNDTILLRDFEKSSGKTVIVPNVRKPIPAK
jgi:biopolymer transport protein ExbD